MSRPKVLHVTTTDVSLDLLLGPQLAAFAAAGYDVVTASADGPHVAAVRALGIEHRPLRHATRSMDPRRDLALVGELVRLFRAERPDIVHTHNPKPGWFGRPAAALARVPVVVNTVHGLYATDEDRWTRRAVVYGLERASSCFSSAELVQNPEDVGRLRRLRVPASKLVTLGNGIDLDRFSVDAIDPGAVRRLRTEIGADDDTVVIGAVGRLVWEKGLAELFDAARRARDRSPNLRVVVVGPLDEAKADGLRPADLERITAETGVIFTGARSDVEVVYGALDAYVLASHREGFPRSAMEASAMGLPVIATDIRGCRQVVDHEVTGLLVPVRSPGPLAEALERLAGDADLRRRLGSAAAAKAVAEFDQQRIIDTTLGTYERLLAVAARA